MCNTEVSSLVDWWIKISHCVLKLCFILESVYIDVVHFFGGLFDGFIPYLSTNICYHDAAEECKIQIYIHTLAFTVEMPVVTSIWLYLRSISTGLSSQAPSTRPCAALCPLPCRLQTVALLAWQHSAHIMKRQALSAFLILQLKYQSQK